MNSALSNLNKSIYYWDWYLLKGDPDNLAAAVTFMTQYRALGGEDYKETEQKMKDAIANITGEKESIKNKVTNTANKERRRREVKNDCLGLSWEEIEAKQGGKLNK